LHILFSNSGARGRRRFRQQKQVEEQPKARYLYRPQKPSSSSSSTTLSLTPKEYQKSVKSDAMNRCDSMNRTSHQSSSPNFSNNQQSRSRNSGNTSVVRISRMDKSFSVKGNETIKSPFKENNENRYVDLSKVSVTKTSRISATKLENPKSAALSVRHVEVPKARSFSTLSNNDQLFLTPKRKSSISVSIIKRPIASSTRHTSLTTRNASSSVKRSKSTDVRVIRMKHSDLSFQLTDKSGKI
jgi:hypothetical protein